MNGPSLHFPEPSLNLPWPLALTLAPHRCCPAQVVRALLEETPGLVLATFSGHDHAPLPPYTHEALGKPAYLTMAATVEGSWPTHNAYSRVSILADCTVRVHGFGSGGYNVSVPPPDATCSLE
jgi:hypothetical protein